MALGLAPVVVDYAGPGELVVEGTGFKVPLGRRAEIVAAFRAELERLAADPTAVARAGAAARARVRALFTWEGKAEQIARDLRLGAGGRAAGPTGAVRPRGAMPHRLNLLAIGSKTVRATAFPHLHRDRRRGMRPAAHCARGRGARRCRCGRGGLTHSLRSRPTSVASR